ncbi:MAG: hypothetical protein NT075_25205 [Chloroflexi bacterium]|nr:hypothetical protein [Chloroflexota bacterium]
MNVAGNIAPATSQTRRRGLSQRWLMALFSGLFLLGMFAFLFGLSMHRRFSHDEHQFIASAVLVAREHLEPYRDFAYFHVPNQTYLWALFYHFTDHYLLVARLFCAVCGWLLLVVIFVVAWQLWRGYAKRIRFMVAAGSVVLLAASPSFSYTSGRAWNHDLPVLLTVVAFLVHLHGLRQPTKSFWFWFSGLLVGFAGATRLSFAPAVLPFVLIIWLASSSEPKWTRLRWIGWFAFGLLLGVAPALYAFAQAPRAFIFGNLEYAELNTLYREVNDYEKGMTASSKFQFVAFNLLLSQPGNLLLLVAYLGLGLPRLRRQAIVQSLVIENLALGLIALILLAFIPGALAPTPPWPQYFYLFFPFFVLAALYGLRQAHPDWVKLRQFWVVGALAVILAARFAFDEYNHVLLVATPTEWYPVEFHQDSQQVADLLNVNRDAQVLTVSPAAALEGDLQIYPEFVNGPFALRAGTFLSLEQQADYKLVAPDQLDEWLGKERPDAILVGLNDRDAFDESPVLDFAKRQQYTPVPLGKGAFLWTDPLVEWGGLIRLGTYTWREQSIMPGATWPLILYLQSVAPIAHNLNVTVRVVDAAQHEWVRDDQWPWGRPTTTWQPQDVWFDGHNLTMPGNAPAGIYRVEMNFFDPETRQLLPAVDLRRHTPMSDAFVLGYVSVGPPPTLSHPLTPAAEFGNAIKLLGTDRAPNAPIRRGETLDIQLQWQAMRPIHTDYTMFAHLLGPDGTLVAQQDKQPLDGFFPTSRWLPGQIVADNYQFALPSSAAPGPYTLEVGLYNLADGQRLAVGRGDKPVGDSLTIATVQVK